MTRPENTNQRSLEFSKWIRNNLPDSKTGYMVGNQDWVFWNYNTRRLMLAEEKTHNANIAPWFKRLIKEVIHPAMAAYCKEANITYHGYHLIRFSGTSPENGKTYFDKTEVTADELRRILSLSDTE
jgi:hypothetical protein